MLGPTFHHLHETIRYLAEVINLPAGYCVGVIGLLVTLGLALVIGLARRRRAAYTGSCNWLRRAVPGMHAMHRVGIPRSVGCSPTSLTIK